MIRYFFTTFTAGNPMTILMDKQIIKLIITDDKPQWRKAIRQALEDLTEYNFSISEAENGKELLQKIKTVNPSVVLLDIEMPEMDGNEAFEHIKKSFPSVKVIILSYLSDPLLREDYLMRGAKGYTTKDEIAGDIQLLASQIKKAHQGKTAIGNNEKPPFILSEKQKDIIQLKANGKSSKEIGDELGMTADGVGKQIKKIMQKMGYDSISFWSKYITKAGLEFLRRPKRSDG